MAAPTKAGLVSRLLDNDSTMGIIAGLTTLAAVHPTDPEDPEDYEEGDGRGVDVPPHSGAGDRKTGRQQKPPSRAGGAAGVTSPTAEATSSPSKLSAAAKKYSVREQRDVIRKLQERNQILKQELSIEFRDAKQLLANEKRQRVEYLQKMAETFTKKVDAAKKTIAKLDEEITKKESELETLRQQQSTTSASESSSAGLSTSEASGAGSGAGDTSAAVARRVRSLENRVELSLVKRNEMDSMNKHFRWQIDKVQKDRVIFDGIYKKLEKELSEFQTRYDASVAELKRATDAKDHVNHEIHDIQEQAEAEQRQYEVEFKELRITIENAMRDVQEANERLGGVGAVGVFGEHEDPVAASKNAARATALGGAPSPQAVAVKADSPLKRIAALSSWKIGFDKALTTTNDSIVSKYDQIFDGIKKATGITDIAKITEAITLKDEENFKRFRHVEGLHREEAALKTQMEELTQAIEEFKAKEGIATGVTQKQQYRTLETKYHAMLEKHKALDVEYEETTNKLSRVKSSVHSIHSMLAHANCARNADPFSLHGNTNIALGSHSARDITDSNVLEYLQAIEIFTSSLMKENHEASSTAAAGTGDVYATSSSADALAVASSPIGHGPSTLSSDPAHKLRVQVPTFGGLNGVITVPVVTSLTPSAEPRGRHASVNHHQHGQHVRKKSGLSTRRSMSQQQFATLASSASPSIAASAKPLSAVASGSAVRSIDGAGSVDTAVVEAPDPNEADEDERAYTYDELRSFASKHMVKKWEDPLTRFATSHGHTGGGHTTSRSGSSSNLR